MLGLRSKPTAEQHALVEPRDEIGSHSEKKKSTWSARYWRERASRALALQGRPCGRREA